MEIRCKSCFKLLATAPVGTTVENGSIDIICRSCKTLNNLQGSIKDNSTVRMVDRS